MRALSVAAILFLFLPTAAAKSQTHLWKNHEMAIEAIEKTCLRRYPDMTAIVADFHSALGQPGLYVAGKMLVWRVLADETEGRASETDPYYVRVDIDGENKMCMVYMRANIGEGVNFAKGRLPITELPLKQGLAGAGLHRFTLELPMILDIVEETAGSAAEKRYGNVSVRLYYAWWP